MTGPTSFAVIVGAMKCGTTTLFNELAAHPEVTGSTPKEPMYFSRPGWDAGLAPYQGLWPDFDPARHRLALEGSTEYAKCPDFPNVAERIAAFEAEYGVAFRFVYIVRDPVALVQSGLTHGQNAGWFGKDREKIFAHLVKVADFERQTALYRDTFGPDRLHILQLEALKTDKTATLAALADFLGLSPFPSGETAAARLNSAAQRRGDMAEASGADALNRLGPLKAVYGRLVPARVRDELRPRLQRAAGRLVARQEAPWRLTESEIATLKAALGEPVARFTARHGLDRTGWTPL
ncbi:sulfotransferase [Stappia sp. 22II-S9-Z10]|nr:sulfotransferase [Stappia sp. 22II-S9-Z10]